MIFIKLFFSSYISSLIIVIILSSILFYLSTIQNNSYASNNSDYYFSSNDLYCWPTPGYHQITSYFGPRKSPTSGASSNHSGIDIAASEGSSIYSVTGGIVTFTGFNGAYGHTIIISNNNLDFLYAHVSPSYLVSTGEFIEANTIIANVGPKYLTEGNSSYIDSSGKFTNGATTGPHLHLTIKKDGIAVNPLLYFNKD